jgi:hypothetical protein
LICLRGRPFGAINSATRLSHHQSPFYQRQVLLFLFPARVCAPVPKTHYHADCAVLSLHGCDIRPTPPIHSFARAHRPKTTARAARSWNGNEQKAAVAEITRNICLASFESEI